jgi:hypothetical protein
MKNRKLILKKEKISTLSDTQMTGIKGGLANVLDNEKSGLSTENGFTCCWCSFGATAPKNCQDQGIG